MYDIKHHKHVIMQTSHNPNIQTSHNPIIQTSQKCNHAHICRNIIWSKEFHSLAWSSLVLHASLVLHGLPWSCSTLELRFFISCLLDWRWLFGGLWSSWIISLNSWIISLNVWIISGMARNMNTQHISPHEHTTSLNMNTQHISQHEHTSSHNISQD